MCRYKPGLDEPEISANATLVQLHQDTTNTSILLDLTFPSTAHIERGAPATMQAKLTCSQTPSKGSAADAPARIEYTLRWFNKTATHVFLVLLLVGFSPSICDASST